MNLLALTLFLIQSPTVVVTENEDFDSRCFPAYLKQSIPDFELDEGDTFNLNLRDYIAAGDDDVTNSPKCTDVNPTISAGGDAVSGLSLNTSDLDNASYGGTASSAGTGTLTITFDNSIGSAIVESIDWVVNAAETPSTGIPVPPGSYCVSKTVGNDLASGIVPNCWFSISKVNGFTFAPGSDVYFEAGQDWDGTQLHVDWSGTGEAENQRVIIGSYYVSNGQFFINQPTNWDDVSVRPSDFIYTVARPTISGTYKPSCRQAFTSQQNVQGGGATNRCAWVHNATYFTPGTSVPSNRFAGLVRITGKYVTVQDLHVRYSAGISILADRTVSAWCLNNEPACQLYTIVQRNLVDHGAASGIRMGQVSRTVVHYNEVKLTNLQCPDGQPGISAFVRCGSALTTTGVWPAQQLWEANDVHDTWDEGMGPYQTGYVLIRGNYFGNQTNSPINFGSSDGLIAEQNIGVAGPVELDIAALGITWYRGAGLAEAYGSLSYESDGALSVHAFGLPAAVAGSNNLRRNNISAVANECLHFYTVASSSPTTFYDSTDIGNTCILGTDAEAINHQPVIQSMVNFVVNANNLYVIPTSGDAGASPTMSNIDFFSNFWSKAPLDNDLRIPGTGDVISTNTGLPVFDADAAKWSTFPDDDTFLPASTGAGNNAGTAMQTGMANEAMDDVEWEWPLSQRRWLPECNTTGLQVPVDEWIKPLATDYCGNPRTTNDIGARLNAP